MLVGDMKSVLDTVILAEDEDLDRFVAILQPLIEKGSI